MLTTPAGSLARPRPLVEAMREKAHGRPYDRDRFAQLVRAAVADRVARQADVGLDIVTDGEQGKASFFTYVVNLRAALADSDVAAAFIPSTSPRGFGINRYYSSETAYLEAVAEALPEEYVAILDAGFVLQIDDPWLILRINAGAYSFEAANPRHLHEWKIWADLDLPDDKVLIPGFIGHATPYVEHPELIADGICNYASQVGRERVIAGADCGYSSRATFAPEVPDSVGRHKFGALVSGAQLATERLWP